MKDIKFSKFKEILVASILTVCILISSFSSAINSNAASAKTTVYVVSKITWKDHATDSRHDFKYNKNGLLTEIRHPNPSYSDNGPCTVDSVFSYSYDKNNAINKIEYKSGYDAYKFLYAIKRDKTGKITKVTVKDTLDGKKYNKSFEFVTFKYNSANKIVSYHNKCKTSSDVKYIYDKKGRVKTINDTGASDKKTFKYDKNGYVYSRTTKYNFSGPGNTKTLRFKNTYKNGRLVKRNDYKIYYKKISVPVSYKELIESQQHTIIEDLTANDGYVDGIGPGTVIEIGWDLQ